MALVDTRGVAVGDSRRPSSVKGKAREKLQSEHKIRQRGTWAWMLKKQGYTPAQIQEITGLKKMSYYRVLAAAEDSFHEFCNLMRSNLAEAC